MDKNIQEFIINKRPVIIIVNSTHMHWVPMPVHGLP